MSTQQKVIDILLDSKAVRLYISDQFVSKAKSILVKQLHEKVNSVKEDKRVEVKYMTLLERDREKIQEGIEQGIEEGKIQVAKNLLDILDDETISAKTGLAIETIKKLRK
ncbi:MAG: hypothetical protein AB9856_20130 [Cellulosilyticaceae bacterium]